MYKMIRTHMKVAEEYSKLSSAKRLKVGAIVVKDNRVISIGYNGTPSGWDNECEEVIKVYENGKQELKTKPEVIHAEANAIAKLARSNESGQGASIFLTHAPCMECSKLIFTSGITKVYYKNEYRDSSGLDFLYKCGVIVNKVTE
jgi:dCMP deaminase